MSRCKLIIVEGIPGSGKTTQATFVRDFLDRHGISSRLYCEGDPDHPADFEAVAHFTRPDYEAFLSHHVSTRLLLEQNVTITGDDCFVGYRKLQPVNGQTLPKGLIAELARHDVYETPLAGDYCRLAAQRWQQFAEKAILSEEVSIFECCFLQNPLTVLLGKHNVAVPDVRGHIQRLTRIIQPLQPIVIYLGQQNARATLERAARKRPQEWKEFLIAYFTQQGWGQAAGVNGFEGVIAFYEIRKRIELEFLRQSDITRLLLDNADGDWAESQRAISAFVSTAFGMASCHPISTPPHTETHRSRC